MLYKIVKYFGPKSGKKWKDYIEWSGLNHLKSFDSLDSILRPTLFTPATKEDWDNCVKDDFKINLITNYEYAKKVLSNLRNAELVGVEINVQQDYVPQKNILGYDVVDRTSMISLITNWGCKDYLFKRGITNSNGLIIDIDIAINTRDKLRTLPNGDSHTAGCEVWAIYNPNPQSPTSSQ